MDYTCHIEIFLFYKKRFYKNSPFLQMISWITVTKNLLVQNESPSSHNKKSNDTLRSL